MDYIKWHKGLSVNVEEIDNQHKRLIEIINILYSSVIALDSTRLQENILIDMMEFADTHFKTEEKYMERFKFQGLESHRLEHEKFVKKIIKLERVILKSKADARPAMLEFLKDWLESHLLEIDREYIECFNENGLY
ncbi:MAG: bacteriohemerythrin [Candidatus Omnitrophica bacterium]|nr:bacteriohemerythrin [Candidatus Omnitrophota bacterium]